MSESNRNSLSFELLRANLPRKGHSADAIDHPSSIGAFRTVKSLHEFPFFLQISQNIWKTWELRTANSVGDQIVASHFGSLQSEKSSSSKVNKMKAVLNNSFESNDATRTLPRTRRIVIFGGFGDVGQTKLVPAVREMAQFHRIPFEILIADTNTKHEDTLRQDVLYREYSVNLGRCGPVVTRIAELGFADSDVTAILATPTSTHSAIAMQIAPHVGKLLIEKPVSHSSREAQEIARLDNAVPFSHFLAKNEVSEAVMKAPQFENVTGIEMWFLEKKGCGDRRIDSAEVDLGYHKFAILKAMYPDAEIRIDSCRTATCPEAFTRAELQVPTAAKISGHLCQQGNSVPFRFMMGKASLEKRQYLRIICKDGTQFNYSLAGGPSPWTAHRMILEKHLLQCRGFAELSPFAHAEVVRLCEQASSLAVHTGPYRFGELAHFRL